MQMSQSHELTYSDIVQIAAEFRQHLLKVRIDQLAEIYGSLRKVAVALDIDVAYLKRLRDGEKTNPSSSVLKKLGLN
jgi:hypothetical protein